MNRTEQGAIEALRDLIRANSVGWPTPRPAPAQWFEFTNGMKGRERLPHGANFYRRPVRGLGWMWVYRDGPFSPKGFGRTPALAYADTQSKLKRHEVSLQNQQQAEQELAAHRADSIAWSRANDERRARVARGMQNQQTSYDSKLAAQAYCGDNQPETLWQRIKRSWWR